MEHNSSLAAGAIYSIS
jgi:hypothetical protein